MIPHTCASFGLVAFMLAFTFGMAASRFVTVGPLGILSARVSALSPGAEPDAMLLRR